VLLASEIPCKCFHWNPLDVQSFCTVHVHQELEVVCNIEWKHHLSDFG